MREDSYALLNQFFKSHLQPQRCQQPHQCISLHNTHHHCIQHRQLVLNGLLASQIQLHVNSLLASQIQLHLSGLLASQIQLHLNGLLASQIQLHLHGLLAAPNPYQ